MANFYICETESYFCKERDRSIYKVSKPLQGFQTEKEAEDTCSDMQPFYGYDLRVVARDELGEEFR